MSNVSTDVTSMENEFDFLIPSKPFTLEEQREISGLKDLNQCKLFTIEEEEEVGLDFDEAEVPE
jgi:hypothetical protein